MINECVLLPVLIPNFVVIVIDAFELSGFFTVRINAAMKVAIAPIDKVVRFIKALLNGIVGSNVPLGMLNPLGMDKLVVRALLSLQAVLMLQMHGVPLVFGEVGIRILTETLSGHIALDVIPAAHFLPVALQLAPAIAIVNAVIGLIKTLANAFVSVLRMKDDLHLVHVKTAMLGLLDLEKNVSIGEAVLLGHCSRTVFIFKKIKSTNDKNERMMLS